MDVSQAAGRHTASPHPTLPRLPRCERGRNRKHGMSFKHPTLTHLFWQVFAA